MIKTNRKLVSSLLMFVATGSSNGVIAHHGVNAQFDLSTELTLSGRVTDIRMVNPHAYVYLDVVNAQGEVEAWNCEMSGGSLLRRNGWSADMFPAGVAIQITGNPARRDDNGCYVQQIVLADGTVLTNDDVIRAPVENIETTLAGGVANLNGNWVALREPRPAQANGGGQRGGGRPAEGEGGRPPPGEGGRPPQGDGERPPRGEDGRVGQGGGQRPAQGGGGRGGSEYSQSEAGIAASAGFDRLDNPRLNCKSTNILLDWTFNEAVNSIVQTDKSITLNYGYMEMISRTIHLDMDSHPKDLVPSITGHSIGKWEEGTLVVDTLGFAEGYLSANFNGVKHSEAMHVVERFSLSEDGNTLNRTYVVNDSLYLTAPYEGSDSVVRTGFPFEEYDCEDLTQ